MQTSRKPLNHPALRRLALALVTLAAAFTLAA